MKTPFEMGIQITRTFNFVVFVYHVLCVECTTRWQFLRNPITISYFLSQIKLYFCNIHPSQRKVYNLNFIRELLSKFHTLETRNSSKLPVLDYISCELANRWEFKSFGLKMKFLRCYLLLLRFFKIGATQKKYFTKIEISRN